MKLPTMIYYIFVFTLNLSLAVIWFREALMWIREHRKWDKDVDRYNKIAEKKENMTSDEMIELVAMLHGHFPGKGRAIMTAYILLFYGVSVLFIQFIGALIRFVAES